MRFEVLSLYKPLVEAYRDSGIIGRAVTAGILTINAHDIRDYTLDKHGAVDDYPYGGGAGMVMTPQPVVDAVAAARAVCPGPVVFFTPRGKPFTTPVAKEYAELDSVILLCGHFEGVDERALMLTVDEEVSMGDYILTGGHLAAMCFIDAVSRYVPGVLGNGESATEESFENGLLEYEQYTRPYEFKGLTVPDVLLSGNHKLIAAYKEKRSLELTKRLRPDMLQGQDKGNGGI
jgi:tRNA (guanine37-N1)-methyltransferase